MTVEPGGYSQAGTSKECDMCRKKMTKWIHIVPCGTYCIQCSHHILRLLFQDIIEYHNGKYVRLHDILPTYTEPDKEGSMKKSLFDF